MCVPLFTFDCGYRYYLVFPSPNPSHLVIFKSQENFSAIFLSFVHGGKTSFI